MDTRAVLAVLSRLITLFSHLPTTITAKSWLPIGDSSDSNTTTNTNSSNSNSRTKNPIRILWQAWINRQFLLKVTLGALLVIAVVLVVGASVTLQTETTLTDQTESDLRHSSTLQHTQTDLWVSSMQRQAELISNSQVVTAGNEDEINSYLETQLDNLPSEAVAIHYISINDDNRATVVESTTDDNGMEDAPWRTLSDNKFDDRTTVLQTEPYSYSTEDSSQYSSTTPVLAFATQSHENPNNAIVVVVDLRQASQRLQAPTGGSSFVVNHDGTVVLSTNPQDIGADAYELNYITPDLWNQAHSETSSYSTTYYDESTELGGQNFVTSMAHTDQADWVAYSQTPHSEAFALRNSIQESMLFLIGAVLLTTAFVGLLVGIPTIRGLKQLSKTTNRVSEGNYNDTINADRSDEIGEVFDDVDDMRQSLSNRINEVEDLNEQLQMIVHEQSEVMNSVANGDLTEEMNTNTGLPALDELAEDFNDMVADVRQMVIELEQSEEEMEEFMFIATHDLREPLRMIDTYIDLLEMEYGDDLDDEAEEYMDFITNSANRINAMIEDLYAYLRAKTHDNEYAQHNLNDVVDDATTAINDEIEASNADITVGDLPTTQIDDRQLREVFENLLSNAIEYAGDSHPDIEVRAQTHNDENEHIISIEDNGIGIPESQYEKIFEVFSRVERNDNDTGTGIGLAICERIVEDHNGRIWVESEEGEGTTFHIALPFETQQMKDKFYLDRDEDEQGIDYDDIEES